MKSIEDICKRCKARRVIHGSREMCPPYNDTDNMFVEEEEEIKEVEMRAADLALAFENEWAPRYPHMRYFTVNSAIQDILYFRKVSVRPESMSGLISFLTKYIKEHPDRYQYGGMHGFRVLANQKQETVASKLLPPRSSGSGGSFFSPN